MESQRSKTAQVIALNLPTYPAVRAGSIENYDLLELIIPEIMRIILVFFSSYFPTYSEI